jgi:parallel beta-helix repeat protein
VVVEGDGRHRLERLTVTSPDVDGDDGIAFQVKSSRNRFTHNIVEKYAGEGFRLGDDGVPANLNVIKYNKALDNGNHGFRVRLGEHNLLVRNYAQDNEAEGFRSQDKDNQFIANWASGNGDEGFRIRDKEAQNNVILGNHVKGNGADPCDPLSLEQDYDADPGIAIVREAANNKVRGNKVDTNCIGIEVEEGAWNNEIIGNAVSESVNVDMLDGNEDCDENIWRGNKFETSMAPLLEEFPECIR